MDSLGWWLPFLFSAKFLLLVTNRKGLQTLQRSFFWGKKVPNFAIFEGNFLFVKLPEALGRVGCL
jgi:hypothetical protein